MVAAASGEWIPRSQLIRLELPRAPDAAPGYCKWCGLPIEYVEGASAYRRTREYHRGDKWEVGKRTCQRELKLSFCWSGRDALRWKARKEDGHYILWCADCGSVLETGKDRVARRGGARFKIDNPPVGEDGMFVPYPQWEADHEVPIIDGGEHVLDNLTARCVPCHKVKTAREAKERAERVRIASLPLDFTADE